MRAYTVTMQIEQQWQNIYSVVDVMGHNLDFNHVPFVMKSIMMSNTWETSYI